MPADSKGDAHGDAYFFIRPSWTEKVDPAASELVSRYTEAQPRTRQPLIVTIGGPSCSGKSSLAIEMASGLGIRTVVATDTVRLVATASPGTPAILSHFSHDVWRAVADTYRPESLVEGFRQQCLALLPFLQTVIRHSVRHVQNTVIEGVHLIPEVIEELSLHGGAHVVPLYLLISKDSLAASLIPRRSRSTYMHRPAENYSDRIERMNALIDWWWASTEMTPERRCNNDTSPEACRAAAYQIVLGALRSRAYSDGDQ